MKKIIQCAFNTKFITADFLIVGLINDYLILTYLWFQNVLPNLNVHWQTKM